MANNTIPGLQPIPKRRPGRPRKRVGKRTDKGNGESEIGWAGLKQDKQHIKKWKERMGRLHKKVGKRPGLLKNLLKGEWSEQAVKVLEERYLLKDLEGNIQETPDEMCWRVAWELAVAEVEWGGNRRIVVEKAREYYQLMASRKFLPNSPTLMNAGKGNGLQYSACYVLPVGDSLEEIFDGIKHQAIVHQSGGGTGFAFSRLRQKGAMVKSSRGVASGPISFMKVYNEATQQIKQGGTRRGANMGILRVDHPDILEFIKCKDDGGITNFNISVAITDEFMKSLEGDEEYDLKDSRNGNVVGKLSAKEVFRKIAEGAWRTGDPGMVFIDRINKSPANPIRKDGWVVESTNPCGEQPLYPYDACNLGSLFLTYFVKENEGKKEVDWESLKEATHSAIEMLDSVIEMNPFPLPQIRDTVVKIRRIGLGVGGWADMLIQLGIGYDSDEALRLGEKVMRFINDEAHDASRRLAKVRGAFPMIKDSIYADDPQRNSTVTTIAPTGTIGIIANASSGIEPVFAIAFRHIVKDENLDRKLTFVNPMFERAAKEEGFYSESLMERVAGRGMVRGLDEVPIEMQTVFGTAHEIDYEWHVKMQAVFQKHVDNAVSKTINLHHEATVDDIEQAYMMAWNTGCMGITVFRDGCKDQQVLNMGSIEKSKIPRTTKEFGAGKNQKSNILGEEEQKEMKVDYGPKPRPLRVEGATYRIQTPVGTAFITVNNDEDGSPFEVFVTVGKVGSEVAAMAEAIGRLISATLRFGNTVSPKERALELINQLKGIGGSRSVGFGANKVMSLPDAVAKAIGMHFGFMGYGNGEETNGNIFNGEQQSLLNEGNGGVNAGNGGGGQGQIGLEPKMQMDLCPSCGQGTLVYQEGCKRCLSGECGYSEC